METPDDNRISEYEFIVRAIKKLRKPPYKGIHSVYSGFNQAFRDYFDKDPVETTKRLTAEGKIASRPVKGGVTIYLPEDAPAASVAAPQAPVRGQKNPVSVDLANAVTARQGVAMRPDQGDRHEEFQLIREQFP